MQYKYANTGDYSVFSSGQFFFTHKKIPAFPIRLISEFFQRVYFDKLEAETAVTIYDPCCGSAYHLSALYYLHHRMISGIYCSDVDPVSIEIARKNIRLIYTDGAEERLLEINKKYQLYRREGYKEVYKKSKQLVESTDLSKNLVTDVFYSNIVTPVIQKSKFDIIFADIPYKKTSNWIDTNMSENMVLDSLVQNSHSFLKKKGVLIIASVKNTKFCKDKFRTVEKIKIGKRLISILQT